MITYAELNVPISAGLDTENQTQRYLVRNRIDAINSAISRCQSAGSFALANNKGSEELLRDMTTIAIYQTNAFGALVLDDPAMPWTVANVVAVYTNPDLQVPGTVNPLPDATSQYRADLAWAGAGDPVVRYTLEQVPNVKNNASMRGNEVLAAIPGRISHGYYENAGRVWVLPKSQMGRKIVAVAQIEKFAPMVDENSTVNLPNYMTQILSSWALEYLTWKQDPTMQGVGAYASKDAASLFGMTVS